MSASGPSGISGLKRKNFKELPFMRRTAVIFLLSILALCPSPAPAQDERLDAIEREVQELRKENEALKERITNVEADDEEIRHNMGLISRLVDVSGYADVEYVFTDKPEENNRFRIRHLSLFFTKDIQKEWKLFSEIEFEDAPRISSNAASDTLGRSQGTLFVEQMYIEYHPSFAWDLRFGRFLTPFGIWGIYHYPPYVPTQESPLFYKIIFPEVSDGVQYRRSFNARDSIIDTHVYLSNGSENPGRLDRNRNKSLGLRVNADFANGITTGASYYREKDNLNAYKDSYGLHLALNFAPFRLQTEYALRHQRPQGAESFYDKGFYAQVSYDRDNWTLAGRYDWYDANSSDEKSDRFRYTAALNYHFAHNVVGKVEYDRNELEDPSLKSYNEIIMAIVVAIGDL